MLLYDYFLSNSLEVLRTENFIDNKSLSVMREIFVFRYKSKFIRLVVIVTETIYFLNLDKIILK